MPGLKLITAPIFEPVTLAEAKLHCRIDGTDDDTLVTSLIVAARQAAENRTGRVLITQTWELQLDAFEAEIELPNPPTQSVVSVKYLDTAGADQTLAGTEYLLDATSEPGLLVPAYGKTWPSTYAVPNAVKVQYKAGYGDAAASVPHGVKQWMLLAIGTWYANREAMVSGALTSRDLPSTFFDALLDPYRIMAF